MPRNGDSRGDSADDTDRIAVIGLGHIGAAIAARLVAAGHVPRVRDISAERVQAAIERGALPADDLAAVRVAFTAVTDDRALRAVCFGAPGDAATSAWPQASTPARGLLAELSAGAVHVCLGTISIELADELDARHAEAGQRFVACPVFGRPDEAWAGDLTAVPGFTALAEEPSWEDASPDSSIGMARESISIFAPRVCPVSSPAAACAIKLGGNALIASAIAAMTDAFAMVIAQGVDPALALQVYTAKLFKGPVYEGVGRAVAAATSQAGSSTSRSSPPSPSPSPSLSTSTPPTSSASPGFTIDLGLKDIDLFLTASKAMGTATPVIDAIQAQLAKAQRAGHGALDWSTLPSCLSDPDTNPSTP